MTNPEPIYPEPPQSEQGRPPYKGSRLGLRRHLNRLIETGSPAPKRRSRLDRALLHLVALDPGLDPVSAAENRELRRDYVYETPMLTARQIHRMSGLHPRNMSEPASRWKAEGKTFGLRLGSLNYYPTFQFEDGCPRPVVKAVLAEIPATMTTWQTALWFASTNGWLDGDRPQDRLNDAAQVVRAARRLAEPAYG